MSAKHDSVASQFAAEHESVMQLESHLEKQHQVSGPQQISSILCLLVHLVSTCAVPSVCNPKPKVQTLKASLSTFSHVGTGTCVSGRCGSGGTANDDM